MNVLVEEFSSQYFRCLLTEFKWFGKRVQSPLFSLFIEFECFGIRVQFSVILCKWNVLAEKFNFLYFRLLFIEFVMFW